MIQILLVDDHPLVGEGTKLIINHEFDMEAHFESSGLKALERLKTQSFDVMLFDLHMPEQDGFELTKKVLEIDPNAKILIFTEYEMFPNLDLFMESGAVGFISKAATKDQLIRAIRCALNQEIVIPISFLQEIYHRTVHSSQREIAKESISLSEKEKKIIQELVKGKTNKEISQELFMGQRSLEYSLTSIFHKLGVQTRIEAVVKVKEIGLLDH
ncbi:response regulator transcription factor [Neobacillus massiliamazoniensis]|jgi:two-component system competent response regulator ComA|uniref:Two component LuxR family transcriptional regulator n=1 Tax=Neobacillus massiliamazoniensis TaxID=1499688 RepID=A0A0U1NSF7_9BACI|nr:response regulator transcription factor [Neobacillus massiliamazoniensis]CRK80895.1 two component LuxR family transcriptional regulator [Neobacillus massiliamazoniensis]